MVNDTVREELELKIERISGPLARKPVIPAEPPKNVIETPPVHVHVAENIPAEPAPKPAPRPVRTETTEFGNKKTSPTLVGFQPKNTSVPDWRLHLQNSVRQRKSEPPAVDGPPVIQKQLVTNGAAAMKAQYVEVPEAADHSNPRVANALKRIEDSRKRFLPGEMRAPAEPAPSPGSSLRNYPFNVVSRSADTAPRPNAAPATINTPPKPRLVSSMRIEKKKYDTNKLPPIRETVEPVEEKPAPAMRPEVPVSVSLKVEPPELPVKFELPKAELPVIDLPIEDDEIYEEIDDLAPLSTRFLAGLFDLIFAGFATAIVLSPLLVSGTSLATLPGILAIAAAFGIVMFVYLTLAVGYRGRTIGMRLFSLEIVDAEENEYPTLHQAAVNSAVFILTMPFLGISFVPAFINEERRAAHDLISGTVLVKEI